MTQPPKELTGVSPKVTKTASSFVAPKHDAEDKSAPRRKQVFEAKQQENQRAAASPNVHESAVLEVLHRSNKLASKFAGAKSDKIGADTRLAALKSLGLKVETLENARKSQVKKASERVEQVRQSFAQPKVVRQALSRSRALLDRVRAAQDNVAPSANSKTIVPLEMGYLSYGSGSSLGTLALPAYGAQVVNFVEPTAGQFTLKVHEADDWDADTESVIVSWYFHFVPWEDGLYEFNALMWANGHYILKADDGLLNSREAFVRSYLTAVVYGKQSASPAFTQDYNSFSSIGEGRRLFELGDSDIDANGEIADVYSFNERYPYSLVAGHAVEFVLCIEFEAYVKGAGTEAELNFSSPGYGVGCPFVTIKRVTY